MKISQVILAGDIVATQLLIILSFET